MFCKGCSINVSEYTCDCRKFCVEKIYCVHIHLFLMSRNPVNKTTEKLVQNIENKKPFVLSEKRRKNFEVKEEKIQETIDNILLNTKKLGRIALEKNDCELLFKLEDQLGILLSLNDVRDKHPNLMDFDKSKNERNNSKTQRKDYTGKCFGNNKK